MTGLPYPGAREDSLLNLLPRVYAHREEILAALMKHRDDASDDVRRLGLKLAARFPELEGLAATLASTPEEVEKMGRESGLTRDMVDEIRKMAGMVSASPLLFDALLGTFSQFATPADQPTGTSRLNPEQVGRWVSAQLRQERPDVPVAELDRIGKTESRKERARQIVRRELIVDIDPHDLERTGWGVVLPQGDAPKLRRLLEPLLRLREEQAGGLARTLVYRPGESAMSFLMRHGEAVGTVRPERVPYYLLIAGRPDEIPFEFQYALSVDHAVGRITFDDDPSDYTRYAQHVCTAESREPTLPRRTVVFSMEDEGSRVGDVVSRHLITPLVKSPEIRPPGWELEVLRKEQATRHHLLRLLGGPETPGLLLVSGHGYSCNPGHAEQRELQGALFFPKSTNEEERLVAARDLMDDVDLGGMIAFFLVCFSAGTPVLDNYPHESPFRGASLESKPDVLAPRPFVARLPQVLLSHGALAVVGHVDRGWTFSLTWGDGDTQVTVNSFEDCLRRLLGGDRLGHALRPFYRRYTALAAALASELESQRMGVESDLAKLGRMWTALNDARNFILLGDPAVYLLGQRQRFQDDKDRGLPLSSEMLSAAREQARARGITVDELLGEILDKNLRKGPEGGPGRR